MTLEGIVGLCLLALVLRLGWKLIRRFVKLSVLVTVLLVLFVLAVSGELSALLQI